MFHPQGPTFFELARQALSSTERGYDLLAQKFDHTPFRTPDEILQATAPLIGPRESIDSALDVCCGTGAAMEMLGPLCHRRLTGLDISHGMLEVAKRRLMQMATTANLEFVRGDALATPFEQEFDVAVCFGALGHILPSDELQFLQQVRKALKPDGRFFFVTTEMPPVWSPRYIISRSFNAAMHARNLFVRPPFIMYYLTFLIPRCLTLLEQAGFEYRLHDDLFAGSLRDLRLVEATRIPLTNE